MKSHFASVSEAGGREEHQDRVACAEGIWALADGLGGHGAGALAAEAAVTAVLGDRAGWRTHVNQDVQETGGRSTLVVLELDGDQARWSHIGDSRLYHLRAGAIAAQTRDHSVPQMLVDAGELAPQAVRGHEDRNRLLRSLGTAMPPKFACGAAVVEAGDGFLLVSDGFWELVTEEQMIEAFRRAESPGVWLELMRPAEPSDNWSAIAIVIAKE